jgi:hypothetical protein
VSFNNIKISGAIAATIDIVNNATFQSRSQRLLPTAPPTPPPPWA